MAKISQSTVFYKQLLRMHVFLYVCISRSNVHVNNAPTAVTPAINHTPMETFFAKFPTTTMTTIESICNEREHKLLLNLSYWSPWDQHLFFFFSRRTSIFV